MHPPKTPPQLALGPRKVPLVPFFCLLCLNNYSKIFQKRRMFKFLIGGSHVGYPPGGAPPRPHSPPRGPRVSQSSGKNCKNSQQLYKNCTYIKIPQILTLTPILGHLSTLGGPRGAKILKWPCRGVIWKIGYGFFGTFVLFLVT